MGVNRPAADDEVLGAARVLAHLARIIEKACTDGGLTLPQYRLLTYLSSQAERASDLAEKALVSRPTLTNVVDGLERSGYLRRLPVPGDRRGIRVELTDAGLKALELADGEVLEVMGPLLSLPGCAGLAAKLEGLGAAMAGLATPPVAAGAVKP